MIVNGQITKKNILTTKTLNLTPFLSTSIKVTKKYQKAHWFPSIASHFQPDFHSSVSMTKTSIIEMEIKVHSESSTSSSSGDDYSQYQYSTTQQFVACSTFFSFAVCDWFQIEWKWFSRHLILSIIDFNVMEIIRSFFLYESVSV